MRNGVVKASLGNVDITIGAFFDRHGWPLIVVEVAVIDDGVGLGLTAVVTAVDIAVVNVADEGFDDEESVEATADAAVVAFAFFPPVVSLSFEAT